MRKSNNLSYQSFLDPWQLILTNQHGSYNRLLGRIHNCIVSEAVKSILIGDWLRGTSIPDWQHIHYSSLSINAEYVLINCQKSYSSAPSWSLSISSSSGGWLLQFFWLHMCVHYMPLVMFWQSGALKTLWHLQARNCRTATRAGWISIQAGDRVLLHPLFPLSSPFQLCLDIQDCKLFFQIAAW